MTQRIQFSIITSDTCELTKRYSLDEHGRLQSSAIAHMTAGSARILGVDDVSQLSAVLPMLQPNQAITCGVPMAGDTPLTTRAGAYCRPSAVARTNESFRFPHAAALFPIDVDVDGATYGDVESVLDALEACSPWLGYALRIARPSASSYVAGRGLRGVHVYLGVTRGEDIPELAKRMQVEQWLRGRGHVKVSKSGALLVRQLSDALVYQPSRLLFEASPVLEGVTRDVPPEQMAVARTPQVMGRPANAARDGLLDVAALPKLKDIDVRRYETAVRQAKDARRREAKRVAVEYQTANAIASGLDAELGERYGLMATRALGDRLLPAAWELAVQGVGRVTVAQVLANLPDALGKNCADPFDTWRPDLAPAHYGKAEIVMQGDVPGVWSHKLQEFFAFTDDAAADLASPLDRAAEKLCGLVEYPETKGKHSAGEANTGYALDLLLREAKIPLRYNKATYKVESDELPAPLTLKLALGRIGCPHVSKTTLENAIGDVAREHAYDPWREAVLALPPWDNKPRLDTFFVDLCEATPSEALMLTGQLMFAGIVMRQLEPGIDCPVVPVLVGLQLRRKSLLVEQIADALGAPKPASVKFADDIKMSMEASVSVVAELAEMSGMGKREDEDIKRWISDGRDVYREPYGRTAEAHPRRFVLIGTANNDNTNRDETGNRRFMPVHVNRTIDLHWGVECKQLLAEAKARFCQTRESYFALAFAAPAAVLRYNQERARRGEGVPASPVAELAPTIVRHLAAKRQDRRVFVRDVLTAIANNPASRFIKSPKTIGSWMRMQGWESGISCGVTYYVVPGDYIDASAEQSHAGGLFVASPFADTATGVQ